MITPANYQRLVARWRELARASLPGGSRVAVVTRGDASLIALADHEATHFPDDPAGQWAGYHPSDGEHAVRLLRAARSAGVTHFALPATAFWWLEHYPALRTELTDHASLLVSDQETAMVFELAPDTSTPKPDPGPSLARNERRSALPARIMSTRLAHNSHIQQHHLVQLVSSVTRPHRLRSVQVCCPPGLIHPSWAELAAVASTDQINGADYVVAPAAHEREWQALLSDTPDLQSIIQRPGLGQVLQRTTHRSATTTDPSKRTRP